MLNKDQVQALRAPFPEEGLSADVSRGFELTSIRAAFVIERLNEAFGPCGIGWRYVHGPFEELQSDSGRVEIVTEVALQYRYHATNGWSGTDPAAWDAQIGNWVSRDHGSNHDWSEPIFACGGHAPRDRRVGSGAAGVGPHGLIGCLRENQIRRRPDCFNNTVQVNRVSPVLAGQLHHLLGGYISRSSGGLVIAVR